MAVPGSRTDCSRYIAPRPDSAVPGVCYRRSLWAPVPHPGRRGPDQPGRPEPRDGIDHEPATAAALPPTPRLVPSRTPPHALVLGLGAGPPVAGFAAREGRVAPDLQLDTGPVAPRSDQEGAVPLAPGR